MELYSSLAVLGEVPKIHPHLLLIDLNLHLRIRLQPLYTNLQLVLRLRHRLIRSLTLGLQAQQPQRHTR
jgi:hypothetical protein